MESKDKKGKVKLRKVKIRKVKIRKVVSESLSFPQNFKCPLSQFLVIVLQF